MAATIGNLSVVLSANSANWAKGLQRAQGNLNSFAANALSTVTSLKAQILGGLGVASAIGAAGLGVKLYSDLQSATAGFETMLGSASAAKDMIQQLRTFAEQTPFEFPELVRSSQQMMAMGFAAKDVLPLLRTIGDQAAAMGRGGEGVSQIVRALGQMKAKGVVSAEEINQLAEAGIGAWQMIADKIGTTVPKAMKLAEQRAIDSTTAISAILDGMAAKTGGSMEKQSKMIGGAWSNLKDVVGQVLIDIVNQVDQSVGIAKSIQSMANTIKQFSAEFKAAAHWAAETAKWVWEYRNAIASMLIAIAAVKAAQVAWAISTRAVAAAYVALNIAENASGAGSLAKAATKVALAGLAWAASMFAVAKANDAVNAKMAAADAAIKTAEEAVKVEKDRHAAISKGAALMAAEDSKNRKRWAEQNKAAADAKAVIESLKTADEKYAENKAKLDKAFNKSSWFDRAAETKQYQDALERLAAAHNPVINKTSELLANLREQIKLYGLSEREAELARMADAGASAARLQQARDMYAQLDELQRKSAERDAERENMDAAAEAQKTLWDEAQSLIKEQRTPQQQYADQLRKVTELFDAGHLSAGQATEAARRLRRELETPIRDPNERNAFGKGSLDELALRRQIEAQARQNSSFAGKTVDFRSRAKSIADKQNAALQESAMASSPGVAASAAIEVSPNAEEVKQTKELVVLGGFLKDLVVETRKKPPVKVATF